MVKVVVACITMLTYARTCVQGLGIFRSSQIAFDTIWDKISFHYSIAITDS